MCGFAGSVWIAPKKDHPEYAVEMMRSLRHRGPDAHSSWTEDGVLLTHNRLSIIDLTEAANQPFHSQNKRYVLAYNGEIYNFRELREELKSHGVTFRTTSDTEVLVEAIAFWGAAVIPRLNGMFAFACWDRSEKTLMLARDRFGIKPLFTARTTSGLLFGSEIKALLSTNTLERRIDRQGLAEFMWFGNALGSNTLFDGIKKVQPGEVHVFSGGISTVDQYWHPSQTMNVPYDSSSSVNCVRELLETAVARQLVADVPVGIFLSGGIDSSAITAFAVKHSSERISTFSVDFDYAAGASELKKAAFVANHFKTKHHEIHITSNGLPEILKTLVRAHDQPFGDAANIPLYLLTRELSGDLKVVLQGDGGDEIFGGYRRYQTLRNIRVWQAIGRSLGPLISFLPQREIVARVRRYFNALKPTNRAHVMALLLTVEDGASSPLRVFTDEFRQTLAATRPFQRFEELAELVADRDAVQAMLYVDTSLVLPDIFLEKVDRSTMANSMEVRVPFLDNDLVDFALERSSEDKLRGGHLKGLLKLALVGIVPQTILDSPKTGFGVPYQGWLRGPLKTHLRSTLLEPRSRIAQIIDKPFVNSLVDQHLAGTMDHGFLLWKLMQLAMWMEEYEVSH